MKNAGHTFVGKDNVREVHNSHSSPNPERAFARPVTIGGEVYRVLYAYKISCARCMGIRTENQCHRTYQGLPQGSVHQKISVKK